jgi:hypothetical protein
VAVWEGKEESSFKNFYFIDELVSDLYWRSVVMCIWILQGETGDKLKCGLSLTVHQCWEVRTQGHRGQGWSLDSRVVAHCSMLQGILK